MNRIAFWLLLVLIGGSAIAKESGNSKKKKSSDDVPAQKDVLVVGGGMAGLAAARKLTNHNNGQSYKVTVLEARRDRYGGRIWTNRKAFKSARGIEVEAGAMLINSRFKDNPLLKLLNDLELETKKIGKIQLHVPSQNKVFSGDDANKIFTEFISVVKSAVDKVKATGVDRPITEAAEEELTKMTSHTDKSILMSMLHSHHSLSNENFSSILFDHEKEFGWDTVVVDGFDQIVDGIVGGFGKELPIIIDLRKIVRHIEVNKKKHKVIVRTKDLVQYEADIVIVALPPGVLQSDQVHFEPPLSKEWYRAMNNVGRGSSNKIVIEFDEIFWPSDVGVFTMVPSTQEDVGVLQTWVNIHSLLGKPYLLGIFIGKSANKMENMTDDEIKETAIRILTQFFGEEKVKGRNITRLMRSQWQKDIFTKGGVSYPKVGSTAESWKILEEPVCPHIYLAGEYTNLEVMNSVHGAYLSGVRAADQILSGYCETKMKETQAEEAKMKKEKQKDKKKKKDEYESDDDDDDTDDDDDDDDMEKQKEEKKNKQDKDKKKKYVKKDKRKDEL